MTNYSRTQKYKDLRERLQNDTGSDTLATKDLSEFESRLNQIDSNNFEAPADYKDADYSGEHSRNTVIKPEPLRRSQSAKEQEFGSLFDTPEENDTANFDNDYLDKYIREVKQYNVDQGNADSENTSVNILSQIQRNQSPESVPDRPYPRASRQSRSDMNSTAQIPFITPTAQNSRSEEHQPSVRTVQKQAPIQAQPAEDEQPTQNMTREDIMAEVQNLVNGNQNTAASQPSADQKSSSPSPFVSGDQKLEETMGTDTFNQKAWSEKTTRQQLLNETTQMRAQLDDYQDNLSEVSDKMRHTNQVLNIVLIVLIIALIVILAVVVYWVVLSKG